LPLNAFPLILFEFALLLVALEPRVGECISPLLIFRVLEDYRSDSLRLLFRDRRSCFKVPLQLLLATGVLIARLDKRLVPVLRIDLALVLRFPALVEGLGRLRLERGETDALLFSLTSRTRSARFWSMIRSRAASSFWRCIVSFLFVELPVQGLALRLRLPLALNISRSCFTCISAIIRCDFSICSFCFL
jgi:hypothetical protein